jgi:uncharacterized membrane protein HdeD (DUF308 family)
MRQIRPAILFFLAVIFGSLPTACDRPRDSTSYGEGYHAGEQNGFKAGFESARPPGFSPESASVRSTLTTVAWFGAITAAVGCLAFVLFFAMHEENWVAISAKCLVGVLSVLAAITALAITTPENVIYSVILAPAPSNYAALLIISIMFSFVFYGIARLFVDVIWNDFGIRTESMIIAVVSFIATMLLGTFAHSMKVAPQPSGYIICYLMVGCAFGIGAAGVRALIRYYERRKASDGKK